MPDTLKSDSVLWSPSTILAKDAIDRAFLASRQRGAFVSKKRRYVSPSATSFKDLTTVTGAHNHARHKTAEPLAPSEPQPLDAMAVQQPSESMSTIEHSMQHHSVTPGYGTVPNPTLPEDFSDAQVEGKDELRRVVHCAVERERRERIKSKLDILKSIVPTCSDVANIQKLAVLDHAISYIRYLESHIGEFEARLGTATASASIPSRVPAATSSSAVGARAANAYAINVPHVFSKLSVHKSIPGMLAASLSSHRQKWSAPTALQYNPGQQQMRQPSSDQMQQLEQCQASRAQASQHHAPIQQYPCLTQQHSSSTFAHAPAPHPLISSSADAVRRTSNRPPFVHDSHVLPPRLNPSTSSAIASTQSSPSFSSESQSAISETATHFHHSGFSFPYWSPRAYNSSSLKSPPSPVSQPQSPSLSSMPLCGSPESTLSAESDIVHDRIPHISPSTPSMQLAGCPGVAMSSEMLPEARESQPHQQQSSTPVTFSVANLLS